MESIEALEQFVRKIIELFKREPKQSDYVLWS